VSLGGIHRRLWSVRGLGGNRNDPESDSRGRFTFKCWRARRDSNPRPLGPQPNALSTELRAHMTLRRDWRRGRDSNPRSRLPHSTV
jgi:hypothetical protein